MANTPLEISQRSVLSLSVPMLFELLMLFMIPAVDTYYVSRISSDAVAAVAAMLPVMGVGIILFSPLTQAGASVAGQYLGGRNRSRAARAFSLMLLLNMLIGLVLSVFFICSAGILPRWLGLEAPLDQIAGQYVRFLGGAYVLLALKVAVSGVLNAGGRTHLNMVIALLMNAINLGLNHLFLMLGYGLSGVIVASSSAWAVAFALGFYFCRREFAPLRELLREPADTRAIARHVLSIGLPSAIEPMSYQLSQVAISRLLVQLGLLAMTTKAFVANISLFALLWGAAIAGGTQIKIAYLLGGRRLADAQSELYHSVRLALIGSTVVSAALAIAGPWLLRFFTDDPECIALGSKVLWMGVFLEWGRGLNVVVGSVLRISGDAKFVALFGVTSMWIVSVGGAYWVGSTLAWGLLGIWFVMGFDEHLRGWMSLYRWRKGAWLERNKYLRPVQAQV